jgi:hypothetical protein
VTFPISYSKDNHEGTTETEIVKVGPDLKWQTVAQSGGK